VILQAKYSDTVEYEGSAQGTYLTNTILGWSDKAHGYCCSGQGENKEHKNRQEKHEGRIDNGN